MDTTTSNPMRDITYDSKNSIPSEQGRRHPCLAKCGCTWHLIINIDELCQSLGSDHSAYFGKYLSATELKVALFIKEGLSSGEIARQLTISVATVKTHRKNIRRKLKIQNSKINLSSYLKMKWHHRD